MRLWKWWRMTAMDWKRIYEMEKAWRVELQDHVNRHAVRYAQTLVQFKLVYQGGHHNVYCDGKSHIWTTGGWAGNHPIVPSGFAPAGCDCEKWNND